MHDTGQIEAAFYWRVRLYLRTGRDHYVLRDDNWPHSEGTFYVGHDDWLAIPRG